VGGVFRHRFAPQHRAATLSALTVAAPTPVSLTTGRPRADLTDEDARPAPGALQALRALSVAPPPPAASSATRSVSAPPPSPPLRPSAAAISVATARPTPPAAPAAAVVARTMAPPAAPAPNPIGALSARTAGIPPPRAAAYRAAEHATPPPVIGRVATLTVPAAPVLSSLGARPHPADFAAPAIETRPPPRVFSLSPTPPAVSLAGAGRRIDAAAPDAPRRPGTAFLPLATVSPAMPWPAHPLRVESPLAAGPRVAAVPAIVFSLAAAPPSVSFAALHRPRGLGGEERPLPRIAIARWMLLSPFVPPPPPPPPAFAPDIPADVGPTWQRPRARWRVRAAYTQRI
jgi:hypothetical protein